MSIPNKRKGSMQQQILNNRYRLDQQVGEGGMAIVYQGYDLRLNRRVAVKILHSQFSNDPDFLSRFNHEALAAANLNHPNVVNVYDVGQDGDRHYIVMQYVDGINLKTRINREAPLMVAHAVTIAEAIARGLEAAHRVGLVHRDIKPQNIMVSTDGQVQITDFGIAKSHLSTATTQTGITFGTADYIAPEQAQGLQATPRSDIYALGITLFEMLTGRLPFTGDSAISVAMQHVNTPPPLPSQYNPQIPQHLEAIILQTIAKDPTQRPASALELAELLKTYRVSAEQHTVANIAPAQQPRPIVQPRSPGSPSSSHSGASASSTTGGRSTLPQSRPHIAKAPKQQGVGCGLFAIGMIILVGVLGLVMLFVSGTFDDMFASTRPGIVATSTPTMTVTTAVTPTPTPSPTPTDVPTTVPLVTVPGVVGMSESEARQAIQDARLVPVAGISRHSDSIPQGAVIEQFVPAYIEVPQGQPVTYVLSLGRNIRLVSVPNVISRRLESARAEIEGLRLAVTVEEQPSMTVSEGFIISQNPASGMQLEEGDTVHLVVSMGDKVQMPNVIGMPEAEAKAVLAATNGLLYSWSDYQGYDKLGNTYFEVAPGMVVSTVPDKHVWVPRGTSVTLGVREADSPNADQP
jgi:serine/threonine-protein kinase